MHDIDSNGARVTVRHQNGCAEAAHPVEATGGGINWMNLLAAKAADGPDARRGNHAAETEGCS